jgi:hypothetical protein
MMSLKMKRLYEYPPLVDHLRDQAGRKGNDNGGMGCFS